MPTPFTHLEATQRLLSDEHIPQEMRAMLAAERGAFLLGNIAADARVNAGSGLRRADTHFYEYGVPITEHPWRVMVGRFPALQHPSDSAQRAFIAGYVAHLSMDEISTKELIGPHFFLPEWGSRELRFVMLHVLLVYLDERDYQRLQPWQYDTLCAARPADWLPFMGDDMLVGWRDFISEQIAPSGDSRTLEVLSERVGKPPQELRAILDSAERMRDDLWRNLPPDDLAAIEGRMYVHAREQLCIYLSEAGSAP